ncbi:hypothetical protein [Kangiella marina]|uniref:Uncharacterized protein n=1 Tax=Kangiella marina TaxID=1079178 RepID=A0ABP8IKA4_9GAMM
MSNDMNNEHDKTSGQELEQKLNKAYQETSDETTSSKLDASILAMAQQEVDARDNAEHKRSWWDRLKLPVSVTAAFVVTVGIARFMVELGYYDPNSISNDENMTQRLESNSTIVVLADDTSAAKPVASAPVPSEARVMAQERLAARQKAEKQAESMNKVVVTGARIKRAEAERARQQDVNELIVMEETQASVQFAEPVAQSQPGAAKEAKAAVEAEADSTNSEVEKIVVTGSRVRASDREEIGDAVAKEAAEPPYLPAEEWILQLETLLEAHNHAEAKEQWLKFKKIYPGYAVDKPLYQRLESL